MAIQLFKEDIDGNGHLEIPQGVTKILPNTLMKCENLISVVIPKSVAIIGACSFLGCKNLKRVELHEGLRTIDVGAFMGCTSLESIVIPEGVRIIAHAAFKGCTGLTSISIPESISIIGKGAFEGCICLTDNDRKLIGSKESVYDVRTITTTAYIVGSREAAVRILDQAFHLFGSDRIIVNADATLEQMNSMIQEANYHLMGDPDLDEQPAGYGARFTLLDFLDVPSKINSLCELAVLSYVDEEHPDDSEDYGVGLTHVTKEADDYIVKIQSVVKECQDTYCDEEWRDWCERMVRLYGCKVILHRESGVYESDIHDEETKLFELDGNSVKQTTLDKLPYADSQTEDDGI